jgi:hypothetical protein
MDDEVDIDLEKEMNGMWWDHTDLSYDSENESEEDEQQKEIGFEFK